MEFTEQQKELIVKTLLNVVKNQNTANPQPYMATCEELKAAYQVINKFSLIEEGMLK